MKTRIIQDDSSSDGPGTDRSPDDSSPTARRPGVRRRALAPVRRRALASARRHPLAAFFVLAYVLSWAAVPFGGFLPFGALIAALVVVALTDGLPGLRRWGSRLVRWRVRWPWYVVAAAVPLLVQAFSMLTNRLAGAPEPSWAQFTPWYSVPMLLGIFLVNPLQGPLGEEPGWRGFAQPRLQGRHSPLAAGAVLALLVTGWHVPLVLMPQFDLGPVDLASTVLVTFWYAWLFNRTGGSALLTLVAHATEGSIDTTALWPTGAAASRQPWTYLLGWAVLVAALLLLDRASWRAAPAPAVDGAPADGAPADGVAADGAAADGVAAVRS